MKYSFFGIAPDSPLMEVAADNIRDRLMLLSGKRISLRINKNISTIVSATEDKSTDTTKLSLHWMFLTASDHVIAALCRYLFNPDSKSNRTIRLFIHQNRDLLKTNPAKSRRAVRKVKGQHYDLRQLLRDLNKEYYNGSMKVNITWGRISSLARGNYSPQLGSYCTVTNLITINPLLDHHTIPQYYIETVIYHEMLHKVLEPVVARDGRLIYHTPEFKRREKAFPGFPLSQTWEKKHPRWVMRIHREKTKRKINHAKGIKSTIR